MSHRCGQCGTPSGHSAHQSRAAGWHIAGVDEPGDTTLCPDCLAVVNERTD